MPDRKSRLYKKNLKEEEKISEERESQEEQTFRDILRAAHEIKSYKDPP